jgi:nitrate reductase NapAB chaperone NapD
MKKWMIGLMMIAFALSAPAVVRAHEGHAHKVMGAIASVDGTNVMVKTTEGKTVMVMLDAKTKITQGKVKLEASALKVGDRVVAEGPEEKGMITATTLKVGAAAPAATKK